VFTNCCNTWINPVAFQIHSLMNSFPLAWCTKFNLFYNNWWYSIGFSHILIRSPWRKLSCNFAKRKLQIAFLAKNRSWFRNRVIHADFSCCLFSARILYFFLGPLRQGGIVGGCGDVTRTTTNPPLPELKFLWSLHESFFCKWNWIFHAPLTIILTVISSQ